MKTIGMSLFAGAAAALLCTAAFTPVQAQAVDANAVVANHGDWTLREREDWLGTRLDQSLADGSIDHHEYDRVRGELSGIKSDEDAFRDDHSGELTPNETTNLEARLDTVADQIHWLRDDSFRLPW